MNRIPFSNPRINTQNTLSIIKKALKKSFPNEGDQTNEFEKKFLFITGFLFCSIGFPYSA